MIKFGGPLIQQEELDAVADVLRSGNLVQGEKVNEFEEEVRKYLNAGYAIAVSSGTAALHLAAMAIGISSKDEIIIPDYTYPATANVMEQLGATVRLVDIDRNTLLMDVTKLEHMITERTKAIVPVHQFGNVVLMEKIMEISEKYSIPVIEDAACSFGAEDNCRKVGTIGTIGCFSFHPRKSITTGEGGILVTNNRDIKEKVLKLRNHGVTYKNGKMIFETCGLNYRMNEMEAALGLCQIKKIEYIQSKLKEMAEYYDKCLKNCQGIKLVNTSKRVKRVYQTYFIMFDSHEIRDFVADYLAENEIQTSVGSHSLHMQPYYNEKYNYEGNMLRESEIVYGTGLALPLHMNLVKEQIELVCFKIKEAMERLI